MDSGGLCNILAGKKEMSLPVASKIADKLKLAGDTRTRFLSSVYQTHVQRQLCRMSSSLSNIAMMAEQNQQPNPDKPIEIDTVVLLNPEQMLKRQDVVEEVTALFAQDDVTPGKALTYRLKLSLSRVSDNDR